ncbi:ankyrin repeat-containing domain protein [Terfezia claveryi]|nr:ankyrin repeat-containing domain protein [Terfezia claveryi]
MSRFPGFGNSHAGSAQSRVRKRDRLLPFLKPNSRSTSPNPSSPSLQLAVDRGVDGRSNDLWTEAYHKVPDKLKQQLAANLNKPEPADILQDVLQRAIQAKEANMANQLKLKCGDKEFDLQETADRLVRWITKFMQVGDIAVQYDPVHAALPWAGVRFILLLVVGQQEKMAAAIVGMERVSVLIGRCAIYEQLYLTDGTPKNAKEATENLRQRLLTLYTAILQALCRFIRVFQGKSIDKFKTSESTLAEISAIGEPESAVNSAVVAVENCCTRPKPSVQEFHKLQELLKVFMPVLSKIDKNLDKLYKEIEDNKRISVLQWFSTVPYQKHHNLACEGCVEHTGTWLFSRKEFMSWEDSKTPAILWLHGIHAFVSISAGAGKTKLVSATIEHLGRPTCRVQFDKVAFFYCKRDEGDRRDREKVLLSLIKQLACPPRDTIESAGHARICADALEAYNRAQKDPSPHCQLNFEASLNLFGLLIECFEHPAVVLDALDECSEEVRGHLLRGLLCVIKKAKCPFKVLISSRHNLDIENYLRDLPHVCIEARDNSQDIENYVRQQLTLRVQDKRLLQGKVSEELNKCIEEVILRGANGMFLWVDWQLRDLCKLMRESDIRTRLGKLPKGLTEVYNEIINSIKSQPDCNLSLATNALKWMLVSKRPLTPAELVAAAELNPPRSISAHNFPVNSELSTLAVEVLIHSCEGLLVLDKQLDVVRFSHLSVQEYLETRNEIWDVNIIDVQLFVCQSCLWTLQSPQSPLNLPLYKYAAFFWFQHCRSYQDLVLSTVNTKDTNHELSIPLLNSFLGPFKEASASYAKWIGWIEANEYGNTDEFMLQVVKSEPLYPVFSAAFAGLGELVSWLWLSKRNNMKARNRNRVPLLNIASEYGTVWIVKEMLKEDFKIDDVQNALYSACVGGKLGIIKVLLDQGADVNITGGGCGTALGAAAYRGSLEIVTLLLDQGADVNISGGNYGTALGAAAYSGSLEIVTLLLDQGADVNISGGDYGTALVAAALSGSLEIVTLLLDQGADVNISGGNYGTALGAAAYRGSLEIVTLLLDQGADVNITGGNYGTALGAAALRGSLEIVTLLLDQGADVNITGGTYGTALGAAALRGSLEIVTLLLDQGADVNITGGNYGTALGAAALGRSLEIVTLLLDRGADVNITGGRHGTALGVAAIYGSIAVVTLLLDRGADVNITGGGYGTALVAAVLSGSLEIVTLLLDQGADVNITGRNYGTALGAAAYRGKLKIVTLLLNRGADVNITGGNYGTALGAAAYRGKLEIVTLLLDRGADVNITGGDYGTALGAAAYSGKLEIVTLLLDQGADVNISGGEYGTALGAAAYSGSLEIVTLLLDQGADVNISGGDYGTALVAVALSGSLEIVTLLLDQGADVNISGGEYGTALGAAALRGSLEIVTLLLNRGADINLTGGKYGTALGNAAHRGNQEIAKFLIDQGANTDLTNYEGVRPRDLAEQEGNRHIRDLLDLKCV